MNAMTERLVAHAVAQGQARANRERKRQCVYLDMADVATRAYVRPFDEPTPHGCRFVTHVDPEQQGYDHLSDDLGPGSGQYPL